MTPKQLDAWVSEGSILLAFLQGYTKNPKVKEACVRLIAQAEAHEKRPRRTGSEIKAEQRVLPPEPAGPALLPRGSAVRSQRSDLRPKTSSGACAKCRRKLRPFADRGEKYCPTCRGAGIAWIEPRTGESNG